jgi:upstream activation factor subunit UAF30
MTPDNNGSERELRPTATYRKVTDGLRFTWGADLYVSAQSHFRLIGLLPAHCFVRECRRESVGTSPGGHMATKAMEKPKKSAAKADGGKPNALQKPLKPSEELSAVVGAGPLPRGEVVSKVWEYIKGNNLQNPENRREILADDKLRKVFGKDKVTMFEMNKHLAQHLK